MLIGPAQWASLLVGCLGMTFAIASLSQSLRRSGKGHLELALHLMGNLKKHPNNCFVIGSRLLIIENAGKDKATFEQSL